MNPHTQVELTSPAGIKEVWWLPVPDKRAKVGEKITRKREIDFKHTNQPQSEDWTITQVCVTLSEDAIPAGSRIATDFKREAQTIAYMTI